MGGEAAVHSSPPPGPAGGRPEDRLRGGGGVARRTLLGGALALTACTGRAQDIPERGPALPLKSLAPFPIGCAVMTSELNDPAFSELLTRHVSQITPEWEMKMEYVLKDDGTFRFDAPDAIAAFARQHGLRLFGHNLIWYAQAPPAFARIDAAGQGFANAYRNYILAVAGRYRGQASGWDVVNEPVAEDGEGLRDCLWRKNLGLDYIRLAFEHAAEADPDAVLILNDYNLESLPKKRATFLKLAEDLLKAGAPLKGLGTQTHLAADLQPGAVKTAIAELAGLGLPIHVSEIDVSLNRSRTLLAGRAELERLQTRLYAEASEAFASLPARQRFAFTIWGLRDRDSWLRRGSEGRGQPADAPLLFDDGGRAKPTFWAVADAISASRSG